MNRIEIDQYIFQLLNEAITENVTDFMKITYENENELQLKYVQQICENIYCEFLEKYLLGDEKYQKYDENVRKMASELRTKKYKEFYLIQIETILFDIILQYPETQNMIMGLAESLRDQNQ